MRILVTNDDGINAEGIIRLAELASKFGEVTVIAPASQCSAMSQKITICSVMKYRQVNDFPVNVKAAYAVDGTPADCVKFALRVLLKEKPDVLFSGINKGYNSGFDVAYSGTIGATMEGIQNGIPSIAFSAGYEGEHVFDVYDAHAYEIMSELLRSFGLLTDRQSEHKILKSEVWNVNFPMCSLEEFKGILWDRYLCQGSYYENAYRPMDNGDYQIDPEATGINNSGSDIDALDSNHVSIGKVRSMVIKD